MTETFAKTVFQTS